MRTKKTAARRMASPNNMVRRPIRGESRIKIFSATTNSDVGEFLRVRTFGPIILSWSTDTTMSNTTRESLMIRAAGHSLSEEEISTCAGRRIAPVMTRRDKAIHTSLLKRRARFTNPRWADDGSGSFLRSGTATRERKSMPPIQKVAAIK